MFQQATTITENCFLANPGAGKHLGSSLFGNDFNEGVLKGLVHRGGCFKAIKPSLQNTPATWKDAYSRHIVFWEDSYPGF